MKTLLFEYVEVQPGPTPTMCMTFATLRRDIFKRAGVFVSVADLMRAASRLNITLTKEDDRWCFYSKSVLTLGDILASIIDDILTQKRRQNRGSEPRP